MKRNDALAVVCVMMIVLGVIFTIHGIINKKTTTESKEIPPSKVEVIESGRDVTIYRYTDETGVYLIFTSSRSSMSTVKIK